MDMESTQPARAIDVALVLELAAEAAKFAIWSQREDAEAAATLAILEAMRLPGQPATREELQRSARTAVTLWRRGEARNSGRPRSGQKFQMVSFDDEVTRVDAEDEASEESRFQLSEEDLLT